MKRYAAAIAICAVVCAMAAFHAAAVSPPWKNCTQVNRLYPHGVGKLTAHDRTTGTPVTNFKRSTRLYLRAMSNNRGLDRDKDGIACEQL